MKKIKSLFMLCLFGMISIAASAIPNNTIYYTSSDGNVVVPYYNEFGGATIVSNEYSNGQGIITFDRDVTSIGYYAFNNCSSLTSVTISNSVTEIGWYAFINCKGLTSVTMPNSVTSIGNGAFRNCSSLTSVTIPNFVTSIGHWAFLDCSSLTSVTIPNSVTSIGTYAFRGCSGLTSIAVDSGNTVYDSRDNCNAIIETASNTLICGCMNTIIPNSVTSIGKYAFYKCSGLTSIEIPNSVTSIGSYAFYCKSLTSVTIPNSVISIGEYAFYGYSGLTSVTIPNSVTSIGSYAFAYCYGLISITVKWGRPLSIDDKTFEGVDYDNCILYVPKGTSMLYMDEPVWIKFKNIQEIDAPDPTPTIRGDVNGDGVVDVADITEVARIILTGKAKEEEEVIE